MEIVSRASSVLLKLNNSCRIFQPVVWLIAIASAVIALACLCVRAEECIRINYAIGFRDLDVYSLLLVGSLCCSGLCPTRAQTFLSSNYTSHWKLSKIIITWFDLP